MAKDQGKGSELRQPGKQEGYDVSPGMPANAYGQPFEARVAQPNLVDKGNVNKAGKAETDGIMPKSYKS